MRRGLLRRVLAAAVGVVVASSVAVQPARANINDNYRGITVDLLISLIDKSSDGALTPVEIAQLIQELVTGVNGVKADVVARLDSELVHTLRGKVDSATTSMHFLSNPALAGYYTVMVNDAAFQARSHINTVSADADLDAVGRAMITLFSTLLVAEARMGSLQTSRYVHYRQGLDQLIAKMTPHCADGGLPNHGYIIYTCTFNGRTVRMDQSGLPPYTQVSINDGPWTDGSLDRGLVQEMTMSESAEKLATDALQTLCSRRPAICTQE